jgi:hypothetical protein
MFNLKETSFTNIECENDQKEPIHITSHDMNKLPFQLYQKTVSLQARLLTEEDYTNRGGIIKTLEGPVSFQSGDYLARGVEGEEWPISQEKIARDYEQLTEPNEKGFSSYRTHRMREAVQINSRFTVDLLCGNRLEGKLGDYLVREGQNAWIVDKEIFEKTYQRILPKEVKNE